MIEVVGLTVLGMGVVFSSLLVLYLVMVVIARTVGRSDAGERKKQQRPQEETDAASHAPSEETVAAISAAVYAVLGSRVRARSIRVVGERRGTVPPVWALTGRLEQMMLGVKNRRLGRNSFRRIQEGKS